MIACDVSPVAMFNNILPTTPLALKFSRALFLVGQFKTRSGHIGLSLGISLHGHPEGVDDARKKTQLRKWEMKLLKQLVEKLTRVRRMLMSS